MDWFQSDFHKKMAQMDEVEFYVTNAADILTEKYMEQNPNEQKDEIARAYRADMRQLFNHINNLGVSGHEDLIKKFKDFFSDNEKVSIFIKQLHKEKENA